MKRVISVLLAVFMVLSTVSFAIPISVNVVDTSDEISHVVVCDEMTVDVATAEENLAAENEWLHEVYGDLLYCIDFEGVDSYTVNQPITKYGKVNPNYENSSAWTTNVSGVTKAEIIKEGNNSYLAFTNADSKWPQFQVNCESGTFSGENGIYTIVADVMYNQDGSSGTYMQEFNFASRYQYHLAGDSKTYRDGSNESQVGRGNICTTDNTKNPGTWAHNQWKTAIGYYNVTRVKPEGSTVDGLFQILNVFNYTSSPVVKGKDTYYVDNLKMYFKPFEKEVTILGGENTVAGDKKVKVALGDNGNVTTVTKKELMSKITDHGDKRLVDLTLEDGSAFETINPVVTDKVKAVWQSYDVSGLSLDFDVPADFSNLFWHSKGAVDSNKPTFGSGYVSANTMTANNGYITLKYAVNDSDGNAVDTGIFDSQLGISKAGGKGTYSITDIGAIQMRIRARNARLSNGNFKYREKDNKNTDYTYTPTMRFDLFFDLDIGDGKTFTGLAANRRAMIFEKPFSDIDNEWITVYFDLTSLTGKEYDAANKTYLNNTSVQYWNEATILRNLRIDPTDAIWTGTEFDIDYIHFIERESLVKTPTEVYFLNGNEKTPITGNMSNVDYRYNSVLCYDFDKDIGYDADEFYALLVKYGMTDGIYDAAAEYDENTFTYTLYAGKSLAGKTVNLAHVSYKDGNNRVKIDGGKANAAQIKFAGKTSFDDGENLIPNGEFTVPYYNSFDDMHNLFDMVVNTEDNRLEVTFRQSNSIGYATVRNNAILFKPDTKYYFDLSFRFVGIKGDDGNIDDSYTVTRSGMNFWTPADAGKYNLNKATYWGIQYDYPYFVNGYLDSPNRYGNFNLHSGNKASQVRKRVFSLPNEALASSHISFQSDILNAGKPGDVLLTKNENGTVKNLAVIDTVKEGNNNRIIPGQETAFKGLTYYIEKLVVKEMYDVNIVDNLGNPLETRYAAKDIPIYLPDTVITDDGAIISGWTDGTTIYAPGAVFVLKKAGDITLTAVVKEGSSMKPESYDTASIRVTDPAGIRFKASVNTTQKDNCDSYGYVVARKNALTEASVESKAFTFETDVKKVSAVAYDKNNNIDKYFAVDGDNIYFTAVLYNIPESNYEDILVVRPYLTRDDKTYYGTPVEYSVYGVAKKFEEKNFDGLDEYAKQYVKNVIKIVEKA